MNLLITAGGTSEKIDDVRHLTNHATGSLGKAIAESFQDNDNISIHYVYGPKAVLPKGKNITFYPISSVRELEQQMKALLTTITFDFVIHSMAVSDYELQKPTNEADLAKELALLIAKEKPTSTEALTKLIEEGLLNSSKEQETAKKISSQHEKLILIMEKAPKVIKSIKTWQPNTMLIGFKLLVDVTEDELVSVAQNSIVTNQADYILANDLIHIDGDKHLGLLVSKDGIEDRFSTKIEIAQGLKNIILNHNRKDV